MGIEPGWEAVRASLLELARRDNWDTAKRTLEIALAQAHTQRDLETVVSLVEGVPLQVRTGDEAWARLSARVLCMAGRHEALHGFLEHIPSSFEAVGPYRVWVAVRAEAFEVALEGVDALLPGSSGYEAGLLWRVRGIALFGLHRDGWQVAFERAQGLLSGSSLGRCLLEHGACLEHAGMGVEARGVWARALGLLERDAFHAARLRYNIGLSCVREGLLEAEGHFLEMARLSRRSVARSFQARALCGIGLARRALGEYERAIFAYNEAIRLSRVEDDARQAHRGLGLTLRLMGRFTEALKEFNLAAQAVAADRASGYSWVFADIAALHVQRNDVPSARLALERTGELRGEDAQRACIVRAELARRDMDANAALRELAAVDMRMLWAREERQCFPELFKLAASMGHPTPQPLEPAPSRLVVEVFAAGPLRVLVNGRAVPLKPSGRAAELLAFLVYSGGQASLERIGDAMYRSSRGGNLRQVVWAVVQELRESLGWAGSVQALGGAYCLDPSAQWLVHPSSATGSPFLDGIYSDWVLEANRLGWGENRELN